MANYFKDPEYLRQLEKQRKTKGSKKMTVEEVAKHNTSKDLYLIIDDIVFDVTKYQNEHPGGRLALMKVGGKESTAAFLAERHSRYAVISKLPKYYVADIDKTPAPPVEEKPMREAKLEAPKVTPASHRTGSGGRAQPSSSTSRGPVHQQPSQVPSSRTPFQSSGGSFKQVIPQQPQQQHQQQLRQQQPSQSQGAAPIDSHPSAMQTRRQAPSDTSPSTASSSLSAQTRGAPPRQSSSMPLQAPVAIRPAQGGGGQGGQSAGAAESLPMMTSSAPMMTSPAPIVTSSAPIATSALPFATSLSPPVPFTQRTPSSSLLPPAPTAEEDIRYESPSQAAMRTRSKPSPRTAPIPAVDIEPEVLAAGGGGEGPGAGAEWKASDLMRMSAVVEVVERRSSAHGSGQSSTHSNARSAPKHSPTTSGVDLSQLLSPVVLGMLPTYDDLSVDGSEGEVERSGEEMMFRRNSSVGRYEETRRALEDATAVKPEAPVQPNSRVHKTLAEPPDVEGLVSELPPTPKEAQTMEVMPSLNSGGGAHWLDGLAVYDEGGHGHGAKAEESFEEKMDRALAEARAQEKEQKERERAEREKEHEERERREREEREQEERERRERLEREQLERERREREEREEEEARGREREREREQQRIAQEERERQTREQVERERLQREEEERKEKEAAEAVVRQKQIEQATSILNISQDEGLRASEEQAPERELDGLEAFMELMKDSNPEDGGEDAIRKLDEHEGGRLDGYVEVDQGQHAGRELHDGAEEPAFKTILKQEEEEAEEEDGGLVAMDAMEAEEEEEEEEEDVLVIDELDDGGSPLPLPEEFAAIVPDLDAEMWEEWSDDGEEGGDLNGVWAVDANAEEVVLLEEDGLPLISSNVRSKADKLADMTTLQGPDVLTPCPLLSKTKVAPSSFVFRFQLPSPNHVLGLPIGHHVMLSAVIDNQRVSTPYTPIRGDETKGVMELLVKVYPDGLMTPHLDSLNVGDTIDVWGPKGHLEYLGSGRISVYKGPARRVKRLGFIVGGTGVTPALQVIKAVLADESDATECWLLFANRSEEEVLLRSELDELHHAHPQRFKRWYTISDKTHTPGWGFSQGRVNEWMLSLFLPPPAPDTLLCLCGPDGFVSDTCLPLLTENIGHNEDNVVVL